MDDSIGIVGYDGKGLGSRRRERGQAHNGAVNGLTWSEDGQFLVTTGTDKRMRVFDMSTGANILANFGPALENSHNTTLTPLMPPSIHADGTIRCWRPRNAEDAEAEEEGFAADETAQTASAERKRKRDELNQIVQGLTKRREM
ncbi:hypothetical protein LTR48_006371 [Friedmanniomyces endolithicus]|uniref:Anaphase-promoting complex subunit 4 WD40 domain-containing protein n=1 Tax=Rachicladosporium monterosium TaxID=1507873 RepID=A0ABR0L0V7_9PEZI|nr:hypothetical protein LTR48_006371 [Friedmanniomyces endolithicus]KAK5141764.1 hypothetical protein LTR32_005749 [Rachicladosporium monterosium]